MPVQVQLRRASLPLTVQLQQSLQLVLQMRITPVVPAILVLEQVHRPRGLPNVHAQLDTQGIFSRALLVRRERIKVQPAQQHAQLALPAHQLPVPLQQAIVWKALRMGVTSITILKIVNVSRVQI